jgi:hypothetical protein
VSERASVGVSDDDVPVSVRLGQVVAPEDPEDWTRPLTWVAALGMLAAPLVAALWFLAARPATDDPIPLTAIVAATLGAGAAAAGATQIGRVRSVAGVVVAGLFAAVATVAVGAVLAGERQVGSPSPTVAHAIAASLAGLGGAAIGSIVLLTMAGVRSRLARGAPAVAAAAIAAVPALQLLAR